MRSLGKALGAAGACIEPEPGPHDPSGAESGLRLPQEHHPLAAGHPAELRLHPAGVGWPVLSGDKAVRVGLRRVRCVGDHPLRPSPLERLAQQTQYTALLSCVEGSNIVVIDQRVSGTGIQVASEIGGRTPLHATSQGKLLLSQLPDATVRYLMNGQGMASLTPIPSWTWRR